VPPARLIPALGLFMATGFLSACSAPPQGPSLLSPAQIALATQGTTARPDSAPLQGRASALSARADALRGTGTRRVSDAERIRRLQAAQREAELAAL
jgi:hypothetical protein